MKRLSNFLRWSAIVFFVACGRSSPGSSVVRWWMVMLCPEGSVTEPDPLRETGIVGAEVDIEGDGGELDGRR